MFVEEEVETGPPVTIVEECPDDGSDDDDDEFEFEEDDEDDDSDEFDDFDDDSNYDRMKVITTTGKEKSVKKIKRKVSRSTQMVSTISRARSSSTGTKGGFLNWLTTKHQKDPNTCKIISGWSCRGWGKYPHPVDCQKYVQCSLRRENTVYQCADDEAYDLNTNGCSDDWSSCEALSECLYDRELIEDPSDKQNYFVCIKHVRKFRRTRYSAHRKRCADARVFDKDNQRCVLDRYKPPYKNGIKLTKPHGVTHKKKKTNKKKNKKPMAPVKKKNKKKADKKKTEKKKTEKKKTEKKKTEKDKNKKDKKKNDKNKNKKDKKKTDKKIQDMKKQDKNKNKKKPDKKKTTQKKKNSTTHSGDKIQHPIRKRPNNDSSKKPLKNKNGQTNRKKVTTGNRNKNKTQTPTRNKNKNGHSHRKTFEQVVNRHQS